MKLDCSKISDDELSNDSGSDFAKSVFIRDIPMQILQNHMVYNHIKLKYNNVDLTTPFSIMLDTKIGKFLFTKMTDIETGVSVPGNASEPDFGTLGYSLLVGVSFDRIVSALY
jgi:hypothetical protein